MKYYHTEPEAAEFSGKSQTTGSADSFEAECAERGLCPVCLNAVESIDDDLDLFGTCAKCGHAVPNRLR